MNIRETCEDVGVALYTLVVVQKMQTSPIIFCEDEGEEEHQECEDYSKLCFQGVLTMRMQVSLEKNLRKIPNFEFLNFHLLWITSTLEVINGGFLVPQYEYRVGDNPSRVKKRFYKIPGNRNFRILGGLPLICAEQNIKEDLQYIREGHIHQEKETLVKGDCGAPLFYRKIIPFSEHVGHEVQAGNEDPNRYRICQNNGGVVNPVLIECAAN